MSTINFLIRIDWIRVTFIIHLLSSEFQYEILPVNKKIPWKRVSIHWKNPSGTVNQFSSVQSLSCVWLFATPWLQHARLSHPSPISRAYSNSCPLCWWCHPTISSSVIPFFSLLQSYPASGSFPMSRFFTSGGQSIGVSTSASVLPMNIQDRFPLGFTCLISLQSKGLSIVFFNTTVQKYQFSGAQLSLKSNSHIHTWLLEKP